VTLGRYNTRKDVSRFLKVLPGLIRQMREQQECYTNNPVFISQEEFELKLRDGEPIQIIDVRAVNYPKFRIPGSVYIPIWKLKKSLPSLNPKAKTIVVCHHGDVLGLEAHQVLIRNGFADVKALKGGMDGYLRQKQIL